MDGPLEAYLAAHPPHHETIEQWPVLGALRLRLSAEGILDRMNRIDDKKIHLQHPHSHTVTITRSNFVFLWDRIKHNSELFSMSILFILSKICPA